MARVRAVPAFRGNSGKRNAPPTTIKPVQKFQRPSNFKGGKS